MVDDQIVDQIISQVGELPAMPAVVAEVLRVTEDPGSDMSEVSRIIQSDPAMTAKILRISNSSYYGMKQYVGTLKLALVILGVREVRNIVLGISVFETLKSDKTDIETAIEIWNASLRVASFAKKLGTTLGLGLQGEEFITGLLSDIGKMALLRSMGDHYLSLMEEYGNDPTMLLSVERIEAGCTHADLAMALAVRWNLPKTLSDALWCQYEHPGRSLSEAADPKLAAVVRIAKSASRDDFSQHEQISALNEEAAWSILSSVKNPIPANRRYEVLAGFSEELRMAPRIPL